MRTGRAISLMCAVVIASALQTGIAQAAIKTQYVDYKHGDTALKGYLANPSSPSEERADQEYKRSIQRFFNEIFVE